MDHRFRPGAPELEKLHGLLALEFVPDSRKGPIFSALGKAYDDIGLYRQAFAYYSVANSEQASRGGFDPSRHRKKIVAIKNVYRERRRSTCQDPGDAERVPLFVVGMSRSGKTLVASLLAQHEDVYIAVENFDWQEAVHAVLDHDTVPTSSRDTMGFLSDDSIRELEKIYLEKIDNNPRDFKLHVDISSENYGFVGLILQVLPMARFIYCHRDPMDNCLFL